MKRPLEHDEQVRFVCWFRRNYPEYKIFAIPNGGKRGKIEALKLKNEGVLKGVHDLHIPALKLWVEMKRDHKEKPTDEQLEWGEYVESIGHYWILGLGFEDAKNKAKSFIDNLGPHNIILTNPTENTDD